MKNIHLFLTPFTHESRALKQSRSLIESKLFDEVLFVVSYLESLSEWERIDNNRLIWRVKLLIPEKRIVYRLRYLEWIIRILLSQHIDSVDIIQCHSLLSLPVGVLIKFFKKTKLVYDAHELETESNGLKGKRKVLYKFLEKSLIRFVDATIVVSDPIADWYANHYPIKRPYVIKNIPNMQQEVKLIGSNNNLETIFNIPENEILFIYVGGLFRGRGMEILLNTFSRTSSNKHIVFMGYGEFEDKIKDYQSNFSNIHFQPAVAPNLVVDYTQTANIGISLIENICLSYYYCLPNKVFEYLSSELPIIVSNFPEMGKLVDDYNCGWKVDVDSDSLLKLVNNITWEDIKKKKNGAELAKQSLGWEYEGQKFVDIYKSVMNI